jgi:hypothetical protein
MINADEFAAEISGETRRRIVETAATGAPPPRPLPGQSALDWLMPLELPRAR